MEDGSGVQTPTSILHSSSRFRTALLPRQQRLDRLAVRHVALVNSEEVEPFAAVGDFTGVVRRACGAVVDVRAVGVERVVAVSAEQDVDAVLAEELIVAVL